MERIAPYALKQGTVHRRRQSVGDTGRVREAHFLSIDRRMLRLLSVGALQQVSRRTRIKEVTPKERGLRRVVLEDREVRRIRVALSGALSSPVVCRTR